MTEADYCICTLPLPILARIPNDFSRGEESGDRSGRAYLHSVKLAFEAPRFWETDDNIFGGLAWTDRLNENVIYPSHGFGAPKGVARRRPISPAGPARTIRRQFAAFSHEERLRVSREFDRGAASRAVASARQGRHRRLGADAVVGRRRRDLARLRRPGRQRAARGRGYAELLKPEGPIVFAGEHLSYQRHLAGRRGAVGA